MADGRFISRSIAFSEQLGSVSFEADYLFMRMLPHLDRDGRLSGSPMAIKAHVCPLRHEMDEPTIRAALAELDAIGLIRWYIVDEIECVEYPRFEKHQMGLRKNRERPSKIPSSQSIGAKQLRNYSGVAPELVRSSSGVAPDIVSEVKLSEVKGSEVKLRTTKALKACVADKTPATLRSSSGVAPELVRSSSGSEAPSGAAPESSVLSPAKATTPKTTWLTPFSDLWIAKVGAISKGSFGRFAAALGPVKDRYGPERALAGLQAYIADSKHPKRIEWFAQDCVRWCEPDDRIANGTEAELLEALGIKR